MKAAGVVLIVLGAICGGLGGFFAWNQHKKITTYVPVEAEVVSSRIKVHRGSRSTTYAPLVVYNYNFRGRVLRSQVVFPIQTTGSYSWALRVIKRYPKGLKTVAYCNPKDPNDSFLVKHYAYLPYFFIVLGALAAAFGMQFVTARRSSVRRPAKPVEGVSGWYEIPPLSSIADRRRSSLLAGLFLFAVGILCLGHYFKYADKPYEVFAYVGSGLYAAFACAAFGRFVYYFVLGRNLSEAHFCVNLSEFKLGEPFRLAIRQKAFRALEVIEAKVGLVLEEKRYEKTDSKSTLVTKRLWEQWFSPIEDRVLNPGEALEMTWEGTIPEDQPPSTPAGSKGYPRHSWRFEVVIRLKDSPDYRAKFPIFVEAGSK